MDINKNTTLCISIAEHPSNFGTTIFNRLFQMHDIDFIYKACKVNSNDLKGAIQGMRSLKIKGCGVSMPHKIHAQQYLDKIDSQAKEIGAINTILNTDGILTGFNTDAIGVETALKQQFSVEGKSVMIVGAGGMARAIISALKKLNATTITIANRSEKKAKQLAVEQNINYCHYDKNKLPAAGLFINATPLGMPIHAEESILNHNLLTQYTAIMDVVVKTNTPLITEAKKQKLITITGDNISLYQLARQFKLYTDIEPPINTLKEAIKTLLNNN